MLYLEFHICEKCKISLISKRFYSFPKSTLKYPFEWTSLYKNHLNLSLCSWVLKELIVSKVDIKLSEAFNDDNVENVERRKDSELLSD